MGRKKHISAVITLKDNMSATMRGIRREQKSFQQEVRKTKLEMASAFKQQQKVRLDATTAHKQITKLRKNLEPLRKKVVAAVILRDNASNKLKQIKSGIKSVGEKIAKPAIAIKDKATSVIGKLGSKLGALAKGFSIPVALAMGAGATAVKAGMELEQQNIAMNHFMGVGNKGKDANEIKAMSDTYLKDLRNNANATPFETGEVISAGTRALQISGGDAKEAMKKVKLAEDMAALNPGKTISDAMEALADMEMGEYARLTEFGVKATKEKGDTPSSVQGELETLYAGGAEKLSSSAQGLMSTITGKIKSSIADIGLGMLEPLKPVMSDMIGFIDQITPSLLSFGQTISTGLGAGINWIREQIPTLAPIFQTIGTTLVSIGTTVFPIIQQAFTALAPIFTALGNVAMTVFTAIGNAVKTVAPCIQHLIGALTPVFVDVGSALQSMGGLFASIFSSVMNVVSNAYNFIKPLIEKIASAISWVSKGVSKVADFFTGKSSKGSSKPKKNATGTQYYTGGLTWVGEHGPELLDLPKGSKIHTNRASQNITENNGNTNHITIHINQSDPTEATVQLVEKLQIALMNM